MLKTAKAMHHFARAHQVRRVRRLSREFQREVCFASGIQLRRSAGINAPAAVGQLALADIICELGNALGIGLAQNVQVVNVIGFQSGIGFEFALPVALLGLKRKQVIGAAFYGLLEALRPIPLLPWDRRRRRGGLRSNACK